jgi:hypothetical protein
MRSFCFAWVSVVETRARASHRFAGALRVGRRRVQSCCGDRLHLWARRPEADAQGAAFSPQLSAVLRARVPFHLSFRAACRLTLALAHPSRRRQVALAGCAAWDVAEAVQLRRDARLRIGQRLFTDVLDVAIWSAVVDRPYAGVPAVVGVPLITETALRYPRSGVPLLVLHALGVGAARRLAHKPLQLMTLGHQALAFLFGLGLRRVERAGAGRVRASFEAERQAAETTATIAGQYGVARSTYIVADQLLNPHDVLSGVRLHFSTARDQASALQELTWGGRKSALEALATEEAVQLDTALRAWKRQANHRRSAVADQLLDPSFPEGHGMTLISGDQVGHLGEALEALGLRGALTVRVVEATRPGARVIVEVNGTEVVLPPDLPHVAVVRADPTPVALLQGGVLWALLEATDNADGAPLWSVLPGMTAFASLAVWSRRAVRVRGKAVYEPMLSMSALAALIQSLAVHAAIRGEPDRHDGTQRTPMQVALSAPTVLAGFCWPFIGARGRWRTALSFGALAAVGLALLEPPRWRLDLVRNTVWLPALFIPAVSYSVGSERDVQRARTELHVRLAEAADAAARRGEESEWERIRVACTEALASLDSVTPAVRPDVERRLKDLQRLAEEHLHAD